MPPQSLTFAVSSRSPAKGFFDFLQSDQANTVQQLGSLANPGRWVGGSHPAVLLRRYPHGATIPDVAITYPTLSGNFPQRGGV
jgi:hypothetical protein